MGIFSGGCAGLYRGRMLGVYRSAIRGADIPNIGVMNFPLMVDRAVRKSLSGSATFEEFMTAVEAEISSECVEITENAIG